MSTEKTTSTDPIGKILIVDDEEKNRELLASLLGIENYEIIQASNGHEAIEATTTNLPDLILLDVMMPDMNGIEVCEILKNNPETLHIPIIMITALTERSDRLNCIKAGARDFLNKPIDHQDVLLRVKNAVNSKKLHDKVNESYRKLKESEALRATLTQMIVHDLKSPLTVIGCSMQLLTMHQKDLTPKAKKDIGYADKGISRLLDMINNILDISKMKAGELNLNKSECDIGKEIKESANSMSFLMDKNNIKCDISEIDINGCYDHCLIRRVIDNLISNAIKFSPEGGKITIKSSKSEKQVRIEVIDEGAGIDAENHEIIFDKFKQVENRKSEGASSVGLGLAFCKLAVEQHDGNIGVESEKGKGSKFWFSLPI